MVPFLVCVPALPLLLPTFGDVSQFLERKIPSPPLELLSSLVLRLPPSRYAC